MKNQTTRINWKRELLEILGIMALGVTVNFLLWCDDCLEDPQIFLVNVVASGSFWVLLWKGSQYLVKYLDSLLPWVKYPAGRFFVSLISVVCYTVFVVYLLDLVIDLFLMDKTFLEAIAYQNYASLTFAVSITLGINVIMHGRGFLMSWRQISIDHEKLKTEQVFTQFQSLKNQVNPHFLFNSLNALSSLVYEDQDRAVAFIRKMSQVYRYVLDSSDHELVKLSSEIDFVKDFLYLQSIRFGDNLTSEFKGDAEGFIPPLALQLLVENAIKHNVVSEKYPLEISIAVDNNMCEIRNTLREKLSKDSTGIGLKNLEARYAFLTEKKMEVLTEGNEFIVRLPILKTNRKA